MDNLGSLLKVFRIKNSSLGGLCPVLVKILPLSYSIHMEGNNHGLLPDTLTLYKI